MDAKTPYISFVTISRNDDHGGNLIKRMQIFIDSLYSQCNRFSLPAELIIVEWNPPEGKKPLAEELTWPEERKFLTTRIITVPPEVHATFENSDRIPLFQMIGKNVGIRRAKGEFIVATNIDILFSDELIEFLSRRELNGESLYRADRIDIISPFTPWMKKFFDLDPRGYLSNPDNFIRMNKKQGTISFADRYDSLRQTLSYYSYKILNLKYRKGLSFFGSVHLNGCGDFTLLSKKSWLHLTGYPEFEIFSWNIDSLLLVTAYYAKIREIDLKPPKNIYHIEHGAGSGWTPGKGESKLFERIEEKAIPYVSWEDFLIISHNLKRLARKFGLITFNSPKWGLMDHELPEKIII